MRKLFKQSGIVFRKSLLTFLAFWVSFIIPIFGGLIPTVRADGPVPSNHPNCRDRYNLGYYNGYQCYIRGIFSTNANPSYTHLITQSDGKFWNFITSNIAHTQYNNQEVVALVTWNGTWTFNINSVNFQSAAYYNQTPSQPNITSPQSLWELGPRTESLYTEFTCDYSGTGQGCNVLFRTDVYDPDFYNFLNSTIQARSTQGGNRDFVRTNMGWEDRWITLNDGNWTVRGESCDPYVCSGWTSNRTFIVDTTAPSVVNMVAEPAYTTGTQNTVSANVSTDNIIGGVTYYFEAATDAAFTNVVNASGWIATNSFTFAALTDGQGYFYRGRSRDSLNNTNAWGTTTSSIQDATLPVLSNINITSQRFSPVNADGVEDDTEVSFDWVESNSLEARISIYNVSDLVNPVRELITDITSEPGLGSINFVWDGRDQGGNLVIDATYNAVLTVTDRAGNIATDNNLYTIVDNVPADISISNPASGSWFNVDNFTINGQTEADAILQIYNHITSTISSIALDTVGIFAHSGTLELGENSFDLTSTDIVGNANTTGVNYYRETQAPSINSITPNSQTNIQTPEIVLGLQDFGYDDGVNNYISGINTNSVFISLNHSSFSGGELVLVNGGVNVATSLGNIVENCSSQTGAFGNSGAEICEYKFVFSSNLTPNGDFEIKAQVADRSGNQGTDTFQSFHIDSFTQNDIHTPTNTQQFNYSLIELTGTAERYSQVSISVPDVDGDLIFDSVVFDLDAEIISGRIEISNCRASTSPTTDGIKEICDWKVSNFQLERDIVNNVVVNNPISVTVTDNFSNQPDASIRNIDTKVVNVGVNLLAVSLSISTDLQYFSPNGDGRQDGVEFINISTDGVLGDWEIVIKDSANNTVKSFTGSVSLPGNLPWDGRDNSGDYLVDGDYTYQLNIITTDGISFNTPPQTIKAVTQVANEVIITYPGNDTYVTRGITNVQGQAPLGTTVRICVDTIGLAASCDFEYYAEVDSNGSFTTIIPLVRLDGSNVTEHHITAKAFDKYGNETPNSNSVKISTTILSPFDNIQILPAFSGVNNAADYQLIVDKLNNNEEITQADIDSLRSVVFRSTVNQGTERVRFSFADHTNLDQLPAPTNFSYLGYIDGLNETKLFQMYVDGVNAVNNCGTATCQWDFVYPVPSVGGGLYEIQFEGKLGSEIERVTSALILDGNIPTAPIILDIDKIIGGVSSNTFIFENSYYSNAFDIQIKGVADSNADITVTDQYGNVVCTTTASAIGFWSCSTSLSNSNYTLTTTAVLGANTAVSLEDVGIVIDTIAPNLVDFSTTNQWHQSGDVVDLNLSADERLSFATHIDTDINPIGSQCINATSAFNLLSIIIPVQLGKKDDLNLNSDRLGAIGSFTVHGMAVEGRYCTNLELRDLAGNVTNNPLTFYIDNTDPDKAWIDTTTWGIYNGIQTQPSFVAMGRSNPGFVHEENSINLVGYAEEGQFVEIFVNSNKVGEVQAFNRTMLDPGGNPYCIQRFDGSGVALDDVIFDGVLVESKFDCPFVYNYQFDKGEIGYIFQAKTRDLALNYALVSQSELVYYDKTPPRRPETLSVRKSSGAVINDWIIARNEDVTAGALGTGNFGRIPISNDRNIVATDYGEAKSDMLYYGVDTGGNLFKQEYQLKQDSGRNEVVYNLGADGVYTFFSTSTDAAGNESQRHLFQMELDTLAPVRPGVSLSLSGGERPTGIRMSVQGEPGGFPSAAPSIKLPRSGSTAFTIKRLSVYNDSDWERTFTFCSGVFDRAGNLSQSACDSVRTPVRPPRPGECELTDDKKENLEDVLKGNTEKGENIYSTIGFSKSCQVYEPEKLSLALSSTRTNLEATQTLTVECLEEKVGAGVNYEQAMSDCNVRSKLGDKSADNIAVNLKKSSDASDCINRKLTEDKKSSDEAIRECGAIDALGEKAVENLKENLKDHDKQVQEQRDYDNMGWLEKLGHGFVNGVKSLAEGIVGLVGGVLDFVGKTISAGVSLAANASIAMTSLVTTVTGGGSFEDNFNSNKESFQKVAPFIPVNNPIDDLKQLGTAVLVVGAVVVFGAAMIAIGGALALPIASLTASVAGGLGAVGLSAGVASAMATVIVGAGVATVGTVVSNFVSAGIESVMTGKSYGDALKSTFCGETPNNNPDLATCVGYTAGNIISGEALGLGVAKGLSKINKIGKTLDDIGKIGDNVGNLGKVTDNLKNITNLTDDLTKNADGLKGLTKNTDDAVKRTSNGVYEIEGKGIKATADEASNISLHLNNGKKFDVDEFKNLKNNLSGGNIDAYINFKIREDIVTKNQGIIARMSSQFKGNWAEMVTEVKAILKGYRQLNKPLSSLTGGRQGIDHVFVKDGEFYIVETKYHGSASLNPADSKTFLPRQMSDEWIAKNPLVPSENRLFEALGKDEVTYNSVMKQGYERILAEVSPDGSIVHRLIDSNGKVISGDAGIFNF